MKAALLSLGGTGRDVQATVTLRDHTQLAGYVERIDEDAFVIRHLTTGAASSVTYASVAKLKARNMSTGKKIAIGAGIAAALIGAAFLVAYLSGSFGG